MKAATRLAFAAMVAASLSAQAALADSAAPNRTVVSLATGEINGFYYPVGGAICRLVNKSRDRHGLLCLVEPTAGNAANLAALKGGDADMAMVQSRAHLQAFKGGGPFAEAGAFADMRSLASLHGEALVVVSTKQAKVKSLKDLSDKKINLGRPQSFQRLMAEAALEAAGVDAAKFASSLEMDLAQQQQALCEGRIDVAFFSGLHPMPAVQNVLSDCEVELVDIADVSAAQLKEKAPFLAPHTISADAYAGREKSLKTLAMKATLVASAKLPEESAYMVVKTMLDNLDILKAMHPLLADLEKGAMSEQALTAPLHEGAVRAYREAGVR